MREGVLPQNKSQNYLQMVSFRNRVVHLYDQLDPDEIYTILETNLGDLETFISAVVKRYFS